jgi:NAD-dependent deacetylase
MTIFYIVLFFINRVLKPGVCSLLTIFFQEQTIADSFDRIQYLQTIVKQARHPIIVTGSGMSRACGLPTLNTTINGKPFHQWFTRRAFIDDPIWFFEVYRDILINWSNVLPNQAYSCIAHAGIPVITQNIDGLHVKAGSSVVIELHGNIREMVCDDCRDRFPSSFLLKASIPPSCPACTYGMLRPYIVFEGEEVHHFAEAVDLAGKADLLLVVGTQLKMQPCNQIPEIVAGNGGKVLVLNDHAEIWIPLILEETRPIRSFDQ